MPITQARMIAVLNAGGAWEAAFAACKDKHDEIYKEVIEGRMGAEAAMEELMKVFYINSPEASAVRALVEETTRFKLSRDRNNYERMRQANRAAERKNKPLPFPKVIFKEGKLEEISRRSDERKYSGNPLEEAFNSGCQGDLDRHKAEIAGVMPMAKPSAVAKGTEVRQSTNAKGEFVEHRIRRGGQAPAEGAPPDAIPGDFGEEGIF